MAEDFSASHSHSDLPVLWALQHSISSPNLLIFEQIFTSYIIALVVASRMGTGNDLDRRDDTLINEYVSLFEF